MNGLSVERGKENFGKNGEGRRRRENGKESKAGRKKEGTGRE